MSSVSAPSCEERMSLRVVLDPAGLRVYLRERALNRGDGAAGAVDEHGAGGGGALHPAR